MYVEKSHNFKNLNLEFFFVNDEKIFFYWRIVILLKKVTYIVLIYTKLIMKLSIYKSYILQLNSITIKVSI
jgi:hypothetical protein